MNQYNQTPTGMASPIGLPTGNWGFPRSFNSQDLRVTKVFHLGTERLKLSIFGECFNVFNIANLGGYSYNLTNNSEGIGMPTSRASNIFGSGGPRAFQLGSRFTF